MSPNGTEMQLIRFIRAIGWGEVMVRIESGKPVLICEAVRTFKLEDRPPTPVRHAPGSLKSEKTHLK